MKSTASHLSLLPLLLALACTLSMTACSSRSNVRELPQLKPEAPLVNCKQAASPAAPPAPKADQWFACTPPLDGRSETCRLSQKAVDWIVDTLSVLRVTAGYRAAEHRCLDELEARGLIRQ